MRYLTGMALQTSQTTTGYDKLPQPMDARTIRRSRNPFRCWNGAMDAYMWDPRRIFHLRWRWKCISVQNGVAALAIYRTIVFLYIVSTALGDWSTTSDPRRYMAYLTNWGVWSAILHFFTGAVFGWSMYIYYVRSKSDASNTSQQYAKHVRDPFAPDATPELYLDLSPNHWKRHAYRFALIIFEISVCFELLIMTLYWWRLYPVSAHPATERQYWINSTVHAAAAVSTFVDLLLGCHRPLDVHVFLLLCIALVYCGVNALVTTQTGVPVYPILTWTDGSSALLVLQAAIGLAFFFFIVSVIAWFRDRVARKGRNVCSWKKSHSALLGLDGTFTSALTERVGINAEDSGDISDDDDQAHLDWQTYQEAVYGQQQTNRLPLFSPPRFIDTKTAFTCSTCHDNACRRRTKEQTFRGWTLVQDQAVSVPRTFTGTESDLRADDLYPI